MYRTIKSKDKLIHSLGAYKLKKILLLISRISDLRTHLNSAMIEATEGALR